MKIVASVALVIVGLLNPALAAPQKMDLETVNKAEWSAKGDKGKEIDPALVKTQVLLDRARFSPGVIDGHNGENLRNAIKAFRKERGLKPDGALDGEVWAKLNEASSDPVLVEYTIRDEDVKGPFVTIPDKLEEKADLDRARGTVGRRRQRGRHGAPREVLDRGPIRPGAALDHDVEFEVERAHAGLPGSARVAAS